MNRLNTLKLAIAAIMAGLTDLLGWKGVMMVMLAVVMALDYISGTLAAKKAGEWSSTIAREGLFHKGGTILVTAVALIADGLFCAAIPQIPIVGVNPGVFLPLVLAWYILTEIGSILENAVRMGAAVPRWFVRAISATGKLVDKAGEAQVPETDSGEADDD